MPKDNKVKCPICQGSGKVTRRTIPETFANWKEEVRTYEATCSVCSGEGYVYSSIADRCKAEDIRCLCGNTSGEVDYVRVLSTDYFMFVCLDCKRMIQLVD